MNSKKLFISLVVSSIVLTSCAEQGGMSKQSVGTIVGAGVGGLLGSTLGKGSGKIGAVALGAMGGALLGGSIGNSLDQVDKSRMLNAQQQSLERASSGQTTTWVNPDTGHSGSFTPVRTYRAGGGQYCREYNQTVNIGGQVHKAYGTACRQPDGSWQIIN
ncbi:Surface antigen LipA protein [Rickettsiales bacterium Ac37b]|nr:Surface antigen LipA protein [Rickettsiales bacterium Ac37b]